jgi:hypothetical protein
MRIVYFHRHDDSKSVGTLFTSNPKRIISQLHDAFSRGIS